jgi:hypothetical protein
LLAALQWAEVKQSETWTLGAPGKCALMTSKRGAIILGEADEQQCRKLAEQTSGFDYRVYPGVPGHARLAEIEDTRRRTPQASDNEGLHGPLIQLMRMARISRAREYP